MFKLRELLAEHPLVSSSFFRKAVLMMELPKRHATSLYGQPAHAHWRSGSFTGRRQVRCLLPMPGRSQSASFLASDAETVTSDAAKTGLAYC